MNNSLKTLTRISSFVALSLLAESCTTIAKVFQKQESNPYTSELIECMRYSDMGIIMRTIEKSDYIIETTTSMMEGINDKDRASIDSSLTIFKSGRNKIDEGLMRMITRLDWTEDKLDCYKSIFGAAPLSLDDTLAPVKGYKDFDHFVLSLWDFGRIVRSEVNFKSKNGSEYQEMYDKDLMSIARAHIDRLFDTTMFNESYGRHAPDAHFIEYILIDFLKEWNYNKSDTTYSIPTKQNLIQSFKDKLGDCDVQSIRLRYSLEACRAKYKCFKRLEFHTEAVQISDDGRYSASRPHNHGVLTISLIGEDGKLYTKRIDPVNMRY